MRYYQEKYSTDYLCIDEKTNDYYLKTLGEDAFEGRSTALRNNITSVCTGTISRSFLKDCKRVKKFDVPKEWLEKF